MLEVAVVMDSQGLVRRWSPIAQRLFGYTAEQAAGNSLGDLIVPPRVRPFHEAGLRRYAETREAHCLGQLLEVEALHSHGQVVPIQMKIEPREENGQLFFDAHIASRV